MKKDRNTFFSEAQMSTQNYFPGPNINLMSANAPYQSAQASQSFYSGPANIPMQQQMPLYNTGQNYDYTGFNEIENRIAKIERQINRLESRVSKLESQNLYSTNDYNSGNDTMYMV